MSKFCTKCGYEMDETAVACPKCGAQTGVKITSNAGIINRNIVTCILLSIVTCGIYSIVWFIYLTDDSKRLHEDGTASGGTAFLFTLITCGIYGIYWSYMIGKRMYEAGKEHGIAISDNSVLYLILDLFGLGIVNYCLIQNDLNKFATN